MPLQPEIRHRHEACSSEERLQNYPTFPKRQYTFGQKHVVVVKRLFMWSKKTIFVPDFKKEQPEGIIFQ